MIKHSHKILGVSHLANRLPTLEEIGDSQEIDTGEVSVLDQSSSFSPLSSSPVYCKHKSYCAMPQFSMKCIFGKESCKIKPFYDKFGNYANELGMGS